MVKVIMWNSQGVYGRAFKRYFKLLVATHRPSVVAIFEPRVSGLKANRFVERSGFANSYRIESDGFSEGIWVLWRDRIVLNVRTISNQFLHAECREVQSVDNFYFTFIYASPDARKRRRLWSELSVITDGMTRLWILGGDLSVIQSMDERRGGAEGRCGISRQFCDFLFYSGLLDIGFVGPVFTWGRWGYFNVLISVCAIMLDSVTENIARFQRHVQVWNSDVFGHIGKRKSLLLARIRAIEKYLERNDSTFLSSLELELKAELDTVLREEELRAGVKWNVNNGCGVEFWNDIWVTNSRPLREEGIVSDAIDDSKVVDWVDVDGSWDWQRLCYVLPLNVVDQIAAIPPPRVSYGEDRPCWRLENNQKFSLQSAYASSYSVLGCDDRFDWLLILKMKIPQRTRVFLWLALHGKLLTNLERKRRHLVEDDKCHFCSHEVESLDHVLRHCTFVVNVWNKVIPQRDLAVFNSMDLDDWFRSNLSQQVMVAWAKDGWSTKFAVDLDLSGPVGRAMLQSHGFNACHQSGWVRPTLGWVKGNADGAVDLHYGSFGRCPVLMAGLWAVHDMLKHAWSLGFRQVEIEIDNSEVHAIFSGKSMAFHENSVVQVVYSLIALDWVVRFSLVRRDHDRVADALAKLRRGQPVSETLYATPPASVHELLTADK
ncbi:hypothetical protein GQ457_02G014130 [Hibiscus cannabinus]